ncbi:MAG: DUF6517 family protein [Bacteroidales bacterium]
MISINIKTPYIYPVIILTILLATSISGCLDTPEAKPAKVDASVLSEYGWEKNGNVSYESYEKSMTGFNVSINTAITTYQDKMLSDQISRQIQNLLTINNITLNTDSGAEYIGSRLITINITLPAGVEIPDTVMSKIVDTQMEELTNQANIDNFNKRESEKIDISNGSTANVDYYVGSVPANGFSIDVRGVIASWSSPDSTIIAIGVVPDGDIKLNIKGDDIKVITINGEKEMDDVTELIKSID